MNNFLCKFILYFKDISAIRNLIEEMKSSIEDINNKIENLNINLSEKEEKDKINNINISDKIIYEKFIKFFKVKKK